MADSSERRDALPVSRKWRGSDGDSEYVLVDLGEAKILDIAAIIGLSRDERIPVER